MVKIKELFDYIYYRVYKFYFKWDKETGITAAIALSMFQSTILWIIFIFILKLLFNKSVIIHFSKNISLGGGAVFLLLSFLNEIYYSRKVTESLEKKWKNESLPLKRKKGWLVFFLLLIPWIILLILGILNKN